MTLFFSGSPTGSWGILLLLLLVFGFPILVVVSIANIVIKDTDFYKRNIFNTYRKVAYFTILSLMALLICWIFIVGIF